MSRAALTVPNAAIHRGSGYHRIYGETTKHALEASVLTAAASQWLDGTERKCCLNRLGFMFWAGGCA